VLFAKVAAKLRLSLAQLGSLCKPPIGFGDGAHNAPGLRLLHAAGETECLGFQSP
jgi:hypothetical protein